MADPARSEDEGKQEMLRRLFDRFMESCGPVRRPCLYEAGMVPCLHYSMKVSVKNARVSWCPKSSSRRRGSFPIPLFRVAGPDGPVEPLMDRSRKPDRLGIVSGVYEQSYHVLELSRQKGVIPMEGSAAPWKEVAVIRATPGGRGISVTSHIKYLVVRLHDILFVLPGRSTTVDLRFSERSFRLPTSWTEERLYAEDGFDIVDIGSSVENLVRRLCLMREQEDVEVEIGRRFETEEEREMKLLQEEATRQQEEEETRKLRERWEEMTMEEASRARRVWDDVWLIDETHPAAARRYSKFKLSIDRNGTVSCICVEQEGLRDMLQRGRVVRDWGHVLLPISKQTAQPSSSTMALEILGSVEGYHDLVMQGFGPWRGHFMDLSGSPLSSMVMVSRSAEKVLSIMFRVDNLDILLDDGMVISGTDGISVDIHCDDDMSSSLELLKTDWAYLILCQNVEMEGRISFSTLLVHLKKKLKLHLTKEEWELYSLTAVDMGEKDNEDLLEQMRKMLNWTPKPKNELEEVELRDCNMHAIFSSL